MRRAKRLVTLTLGSTAVLAAGSVVTAWSRLRHINLPMQLTHDYALTVTRPDDKCWSCDEVDASDDDTGLCASCRVRFTAST